MYLFSSGFRGSQCGFVLVKEDKNNKKEAKRRYGLFVIIYTPKLGLVHIFSAQHGEKIFSLNVSKNGRLIYDPRGYFVPSASPRNSTLYHNEVVLVTPEGIIEFLVPFHCALE